MPREAIRRWRRLRRCRAPPPQRRAPSASRRRRAREHPRAGHFEREASFRIEGLWRKTSKFQTMCSAHFYSLAPLLAFSSSLNLPSFLPSFAFSQWPPRCVQLQVNQDPVARYHQPPVRARKLTAGSSLSKLSKNSSSTRSLLAPLQWRRPPRLPVAAPPLLPLAAPSPCAPPRRTTGSSTSSPAVAR